MTDRSLQPLLEGLRQRFEHNPQRHPDRDWEEVRAALAANPAALRSLAAMEQSGGEPDLVDIEPGQLIFCDCSAESPTGRRSLCYDQAALDARKEHKPDASAIATADAMGVTLLTEEQYQRLQGLGEFDRKTSSWILTPGEIRALGGALFGDRRYGRAFIYHNGAQSYYAARGFRALLRL